MFSFILSFLPKLLSPKSAKWFGIIAVVAFLSLWVNWSLGMKEEVGKLNQVVVQQKAEIKNVKEQARIQINGYEAVIKQQQLTFEKLQSEGQKNKQEIVKLQDTLTKKQQEYKAGITDILKRPRPQDCEQSINYLKSEAGKIKW